MGKLYNEFGGNSNEISEETSLQNPRKTNKENNKTLRRYSDGIKELDNSSFSLKETLEKYMFSNI